MGATDKDLADGELEAGAYIATTTCPGLMIPYVKGRMNKWAAKWERKLNNRRRRKLSRRERKTLTTTTRCGAWSRNGLREDCEGTNNTETSCNKRRLGRRVEHAISDSGATAHFLIEGAPVVNLERAKFPIAIKLPDGKIIYSTHTCNLNIPWLPHAVTEGHIFPGLAHSSLISTRKFCDAGCRVAFDD